MQSSQNKLSTAQNEIISLFVSQSNEIYRRHTEKLQGTPRPIKAQMTSNQ